MSKEKYIPRLREKYNKEIVGELGKAFKISNKMRVPKISKISINMGMGDARDNKNSLKQAIDELTNITGQKAVVTRAKKAISNFKLREGDPVGIKVTLRGNVMYEFLDRLISIATPRIRDFRGFSSKGFDSFGNYSNSINATDFGSQYYQRNCTRICSNIPVGISNRQGGEGIADRLLGD